MHAPRLGLEAGYEPLAFVDLPGTQPWLSSSTKPARPFAVKARSNRIGRSRLETEDSVLVEPAWPSRNIVEWRRQTVQLVALWTGHDLVAANSLILRRILRLMVASWLFETPVCTQSSSRQPFKHAQQNQLGRHRRIAHTTRRNAASCPPADSIFSTHRPSSPYRRTSQIVSISSIPGVFTAGALRTSILLLFAARQEGDNINIRRLLRSHKHSCQCLLQEILRAEARTRRKAPRNQEEAVTLMATYLLNLVLAVFCGPLSCSVSGAHAPAPSIPILIYARRSPAFGQV